MAARLSALIGLSLLVDHRVGNASEEEMIMLSYLNILKTKQKHILDALQFLVMLYLNLNMK